MAGSHPGTQNPTLPSSPQTGKTAFPQVYTPGQFRCASKAEWVSCNFLCFSQPRTAGASWEGQRRLAQAAGSSLEGRLLPLRC
jgi:hypothetical protein